MARQALSRRLQFLHESAHTLAVQSPHAAAHLESQFDRLAVANELNLPDSRRRGVCGACGNVMVPGWSSHVKLEASRRKRKGKHVTDKIMVYQCDHCRLSTRRPVGDRNAPRPLESASKHEQPVSAAGSDVSLDVATIGLTGTTSANASSKKRAKARKQNNLQSLISKNKQDSTSKDGFGLDLMDFMKTG
ncbi:hypothetical protein BDY21DRAFT_279526 [Lineolata rhizophorae]|uniref:RNAse P Rpr2/Rpp21/SNM1 subunit domain-containing protein n=1 Tax=Lineolata rhizophorae TaxID=578093 RepID=A0A6A6PBU3_9PEZI|nr:hypothetical protein BDY21DRAFT_279526 [Lineolata rhizophorae]